jgi:hypothetical protein
VGLLLAAFPSTDKSADVFKGAVSRLQEIGMQLQRQGSITGENRAKIGEWAILSGKLDGEPTGWVEFYYDDIEGAVLGADVRTAERFFDAWL